MITIKTKSAQEIALGSLIKTEKDRQRNKMEKDLAKQAVKDYEKTQEKYSKTGMDKNIEKTQGKKTAWTLEKAKELDTEYANKGESTKISMIDAHFPSNIKQGRSRLKTALQAKQRPFSSYLYQNLIDYSEKSKNGEISDDVAKTLINYENTLGKELAEKGTLGLDLTKTFQPNAIAYFASRGVDINLKTGNRWMGPTQMKEAIRKHEFTDKDQQKLKTPVNDEVTLNKQARIRNILNKHPSAKGWIEQLTPAELRENYDDLMKGNFNFGK